MNPNELMCIYELSATCDDKPEGFNPVEEMKLRHENSKSVQDVVKLALYNHVNYLLPDEYRSFEPLFNQGGMK